MTSKLSLFLEEENPIELNVVLACEISRILENFNYSTKNKSVKANEITLDLIQVPFTEA